MIIVPAAEAAAAPARSGSGINVLVIDRQPLFVAALGSLLGGLTTGATVTTAARSDAGLEIARSHAVDLVCCEMNAEPVSGAEYVRTLAIEKPSLPVILLGDTADETEFAAAIAAEPAGLFTKSCSPYEFLAGVNAVMSGHRAIGSGVIARVFAQLSAPPAPDRRRFAKQLSPTELEILALIGQAQSIPAIAASRGISHKTVRNHLAKIYRKLELHGRTEAMLWAARMGLTTL